MVQPIFSQSGSLMARYCMRDSGNQWLVASVQWTNLVLLLAPSSFLIAHRSEITSVTCRVLPLYLRWPCMGYTALLFCPEEKTARTVTQVLSELEFSVEACAEPFAAVKKLMSQHFDAVVVDCDNEQNAALLFKSARNSTSNQASLAVAVVEGQAGVAKAFRIGANLVLTKPINIEQSKGTLRVARGLLRKGDPAKPGAAPAATTPAPAATAPTKPAAPKPVAPLRPA